MNSLENILSELNKWLMLTLKEYNSIKSYGFIIRQARRRYCVLRRKIHKNSKDDETNGNYLFKPQ